MKSMKKLHIGGVYYGQHNIGDEAILLSILKSMTNFRLSVSTYGSEWIDEIFNDVERRTIELEYSKPKMGLFIDPKKRIFKNLMLISNEIKYLKTKDMYLCGGATILSDCPWYSLRTVQVANFSGVPAVLWGVGMAEIKDGDTIEYIKKILNSNGVKKVFTRDPFVRERLIKLGVSANKVAVSYDPAIMITGKELNLDYYIGKEKQGVFNNGRINVVLSVSGESDVVDKTPVDEIIYTAKAIQTQMRANVVLIPTGCGAQCLDSNFLRTISDELDPRYTILVEKEFAPEHLVEFLKGVDFIISSRLHMNIFGACAGVPSIGLVRNQKIIDFANLFDLPYIALERLKGQELFELSNRVLNNREIYSDSIKIKVNEMRKVYIDAVKTIESIS